MDQHFLGHSTADLRDAFAAFREVYARRPRANNVGGIKIEHMFALWFMLRELQPELVIESGVWFGQSSWLIEQVAPQARLICLDPMLQPGRYQPARASYSTTDFPLHDWTAEIGDTPIDKVVCFFDDHHGMARLFQAQGFGFRHVIFEDNFCHPGGSFNHDFAPKWIRAAEKYIDESDRLFTLIEAFCRANPQFAGETIESAKRFFSEVGISRYLECANFFGAAVEVYDEFPPLLPLDRATIDTAWTEAFAAETKPPVFDAAPMPLAREEFDYNFIAYIRLA